MDYIILGFFAIGVFFFMVFKMKLALRDAGTPKYGYPMGGQPEDGNNRTIHDRYNSGSIFSLFMLFGVIVLIMYFMVRFGYNGDATTRMVETVLNPSALNDGPTDRNRQDVAPAPNNPPGQVAKQEERLNVSPQVDTYEQAEVNRAPSRYANSAKVTEAPAFDPTIREVPRGGGYWLQVAALSNESKAFELAEYYQGLDGLDAKVVPEPSQGMYKVRIGPFPGQAEARALRSKYGKSWFVVED